MKPTISLKDNHLDLLYKGDTHKFHYLWLAHNCDCTQLCKHPQTLERIRDACQIPENISPTKVQILEEIVKLSIEWSEGNHTSVYDLDWLLKNSYAVNIGQAKPPQCDVNSIQIDYEKIMKSSTSVEEAKKTYHKECKLRLEKYGAVLTLNRGLDTEEIIRDFLPDGVDVVHSHFGRYEDLRTNNTTNKNTDQLGYTNVAVEPHTDQPFIENPPGLQMLHCISPADSGGENFLIDARELAYFLRDTDPLSYNLLTTVPVTFHRKQKNFESITKYPLIELDENQNFKSIRYSYFTHAPFQLPYPLMDAWYKAYVKFGNLVRDSKNQYFFTLQSGDYLLYNNHTMLHGRNGFSGNRHLRGIYYDLETVSKKLKDY